MENKKFVGVISLWAILLLVLAFSQPLYAYDQETTHRALTRNITRLFSHYHPGLLSSEEALSVEKGSVEEDGGTRPLRHFYDPVYDRGILGNVTSKEWAQSSALQARADTIFSPQALTQPAFSFPSDYSWQRAVYDYVHGDKKRGLEGLGHILHLIEDASVPDHTRNDPHPPFLEEILHVGSPYEAWTRKFTVANTIISEKLTEENRKPLQFESLDRYFDNMATYSNKHFFSKDSILKKDYDNPKITLEVVKELSDNHNYAFAVGTMEGKEYDLALITKKRNLLTGALDKEYSLIDPDYVTLTGYWNRLSEEAVLHGAGIVELFFKDVHSERQTHALLHANKSFLAKLRETFGSDSAAVGSAALSSSVAIEPVADELVSKPDPLSQKNTENHWLSDGVVSETLKPKNDPIVTFAALPSVKQINTPQQLVPKTTEISKDQQVAPASSVPKSLPASSPAVRTQYPGFGAGGEIALRDNMPNTSLVSSSGSNQAVAPPASQENNTQEITTVSSNTSDFFARNCFSLQNTTCIMLQPDISLQWQFAIVNGTYQLFDNGQEFLATSSTSADLHLSYGTHTLLLQASNQSTTTARMMTVDVLESPIVINEVAWAGTQASSADEWIELYNKSSYTLGVSDLTLLSAEGSPYLRLSGSIPSHGYYLIERGSDDTVSDIVADIVLPFTGLSSGIGLNNVGEHLSLIYATEGYASTTLDTTPVLSACSNGWCFGEASPAYASMERSDPQVRGSDPLNWHTHTSQRTNGKDSAGAFLSGTAKALNTTAPVTPSTQSNPQPTSTSPAPSTSTSTPLASIGEPIGYICPPQQGSYVEGGYYYHTGVVVGCYYVSETIGGNRYGGIYKGVVGASTRINTHFMGTSVNSFESNDSIQNTNPQDGDRYFTVIYEVGGDIQKVAAFETNLLSGGVLPAGVKYGIINWRYGQAPVAAQ